VEVEVEVEVTVTVTVKFVEELKMKLLLSTVTVVFLLLSGSVYANKEFVGESTRDANVESEALSCSDDSYYNEKLGSCVRRDGQGSRFTQKPRFTRCTKDLNRWGHSSRCGCAIEDQEYNQQIGKCETVKEALNSQMDQESVDDIAEQAGVIAGCEGGSISTDGLEISCPDGSVYHRSRSTTEDLSRSLSEMVEDRNGDTEVEDGSAYSESSVGAR